ncbi:HTH-type transcriptional regulator CdhR [Zhongshania aliphaticivorans]|uniref:HTH-type transcriptional regulator CdhR n=1 Tax=Zhongshania aliphaticivorans TaxID=1470434 RepID=A0A5S9MXY8_9GAMM|nr:helix-turn-helix domain-containing protein [Zhongshania aliphaticivorans]CAA0082028.1 HTH-type transcriptional regulator CdhR [Zhongshania aliphaticivorans]CAA0084615.1 HTH-type transcriptional regulator CdhR [Zhongshania aliphaticivorans]
MPKVYTIAYENCYAGSLANPQDLFTVANSHWREQYQRSEGGFEWEVLSEHGDPVKTASGLRVAVDGALKDVEPGSIVIVPAMNYPGGKAFSAKLLALRGVIDWLRRQYANGCIISAHCTSSFVVAETGLLDGLSATTSWWLATQFSQRYPSISLSAGQLVVENERLITGGANGAEVLSGLLLVDRFMGKAMASLCAKTLLVDTNMTQQTPYLILPQQPDHNDALVLSVQDRLEKNLAEPFSLEALAQQCHVSTRTLMRRFKAAVGDTPNSYLQSLRIEAAKKLLESTGLSAELVMQRVGYVDASSFNRLFLRKTGLTPRAYRQKFAYL